MSDIVWKTRDEIEEAMERECADLRAQLEAVTRERDGLAQTISINAREAARLREALKWSLDELDAAQFDPDEHSQDAVTARWRATDKARAALASAPIDEPTRADAEGWLKAGPEEPGGTLAFHAESSAETATARPSGETP